MLKVGITGGIGSGKSTVARMFEVLGVPVFYADSEARKMMEDDDEVRAQIEQRFGKEAYDGATLNREYLSKRVFSTRGQLEQLNMIVHPAILRRADVWMGRQTTPYALKEAALIFESGGQRFLDLVIGVQAPEALRIARVIRREGIDRDTVLSRMKHQISESVKMRLCDHVIQNNDLELVIPQVIALHEKLLGLSAT
jgi:dephospho-CoA kinase